MVVWTLKVFPVQITHSEWNSIICFYVDSLEEMYTLCLLLSPHSYTVCRNFSHDRTQIFKEFFGWKITPLSQNNRTVLTVKPLLSFNFLFLHLGGGRGCERGRRCHWEFTPRQWHLCRWCCQMNNHCDTRTCFHRDWCWLYSQWRSPSEAISNGLLDCTFIVCTFVMLVYLFFWVKLI